MNTVNTTRSSPVLLHWALGTTLALIGGAASFAFIAHAQSTTTPTLIGNELAFGSSGADVKTLQTLLATSAAVYPAGLVTGYYGPLTRDAVTQFQIGYGLPPVGVVGPLTLAKLNQLIASGETVDVNAPSISNVHVATTTAAVTITWTTNENSFGSVHYDTLPITMFETSSAHQEPQTSGSVASESIATSMHSITLTGLVSGETYYFTVESRDPTGNISVTLPAAFTAP